MNFRRGFSGYVLGLLIVCSALLVVPSAASPFDSGGACVGCDIAVHLLQGWAELEEIPICEFLENFCQKYLPAGAAQICDSFVAEYGPEVIDLLAEGASPDDVCFELGFCRPFPECRLYPDSGKGYVRKEFPINPGRLGMFPERKYGATPWDWLKELLDRLAVDHLPIFDVDNDHHSGVYTLRGGNWRGRDCNDADAAVYPGRAVGTGKEFEDYNCNGIYGKDPATGKSYKQLWCDESKAVQYGVVAIGGSATAHFHIPLRFLDSHHLSVGQFDDILTFAEDECDWPHRSCWTGFEDPPNSTFYNEVDSIYRELYEWNHCVHRDYQNLGVNGWSQLDLGRNIKVVQRNQTTDNPVLMFINPWGDDVCNSNVKDPLGHMSTPEEFRASTLATLEALDKQYLPRGSHVFLVGLINGSIMGDILRDYKHPVGGGTYMDFYNFMTCVNENPCTPWLQKNESIRHAGSERAEELNAQYDDVAKKHGKDFKNFDVHYLGHIPGYEIIEQYKAQGGDPIDLMEPVDGFHPSSLMHRFVGQWFWKVLTTDYPDILGPKNEFNEQIKAKFGDQGGY